MPRLYEYVGPEEIRRRAFTAPAGVRTASPLDLENWARQTGQRPNREGLIAATFVVDEQGNLCVADRGSEHIACSGSRAVLSAGELFFLASEVVEVSNQSTGFCPEPESWPVVAAALDRAGLHHPGRFTREVVFRRCPACGQRNIVKDGWFVCGVCGVMLPREWNFMPSPPGP
jgi:hypothetical protein